MTNEEFCSKLVKLVHENPLLYNTAHLQHKNSAKRLEVWESIGQELNASGEDCAKRWRYLRDRYRVKHKKMSEPGANMVHILSSFPYYDNMRFLDDFKSEHKGSNQWCQTGSKDNSFECEMDDGACLLAGSNNDELARIISAQLGEPIGDPKLSPSTSRSDDYEPKTKYSRADPEEAMEKMLETSVEVLKESNDVLKRVSASKSQLDDRQEAFMRYVMARLREMSPSRQRRIEDRVIDLLREVK
ncbi:hypothetical protein QR680_006564 [Steinernema hermaphroditum]|uniref:MADF domain-containing protein n=1 Tax=Steinernema hermaphroditum TaxID=289476 RepID=A0AA39LXN0_9BILA|nr:hypothetical protein QR680_006564 [Steinernema hermaphroditum]